MKKPASKVLVACLALCVLILGLPLTSHAQQKVLKIGCVTNFNTKEGVEIKKWHDLFAKTINAQGGWKIGKETYRLDFLTYDDKGDQPATRAALEKLIYQDKVNYIVDNFLASESLTSELCGQQKIICTGEGFLPDATKPNVEYYWRANGIYFARAFHYTVYSDYYKKGRAGRACRHPGPGRRERRPSRGIRRRHEARGVQGRPTHLFPPGHGRLRTHSDQDQGLRRRHDRSRRFGRANGGQHRHVLV